MKLLFWLSLFLVFYAYFGYALVLLFIDAYRRFFSGYKQANYSHAQQEQELPSLSFIVTAYNEEGRIKQKLENSLSQHYPREKLEIVVASDCSEDNTDSIVSSYADRGVGLVRAPERKGKEHAQMHAVRAATGEILVFSDVATILEPNALQQIAGNFRNPEIGCVSSEDRFIDRRGTVSGEGLYVKYEMFIRNLESRVNTLVGLSGSFFAARREVCRDWAPDLQSDFNTLLNSVKMGFKGVSDPKSIGYYKDITDERKEFQRKVRTVLRGITVLMRNWRLLNPFRQGLFGWQLLSHKLLRWLVPFFLLLAFFSNLALLGSGVLYNLLFGVQVLFYSAALVYFLQWKKDRQGQSLFKQEETGFPEKKSDLGASLKKIYRQTTRIAFYFVSVNASILIAWIKFIFGERTTLWEPSQR